MKTSKRVALCGLLVAVALVLSLVEGMFPLQAVVPVPGLKLGLANVVTVFALTRLRLRDTLWIVVVRVTLASVFMGSVTAFLFSLFGGLLAMVLMTVLGSSIFNVILAVGIGNIPSFARVVRGEVHIIKNEEYCNAARVIGVSNARMLFTHILPNTISPLIVYATLGIAGAIISEAALSFLGLGISEPTASWGSILQTGKFYLNTAPHIATYSGIFILITVLGFNLLGDGVRDVLDPKMKK